MKRYRVIVVEVVPRRSAVKLPDPDSKTPLTDALSEFLEESAHVPKPALDCVVEVEEVVTGFDNESERNLAPRPRTIQSQVRAALEAARPQ